MQAPVTTSAGWWSFSRTLEAAIQTASITGSRASLEMGEKWCPDLLIFEAKKNMEKDEKKIERHFLGPFVLPFMLAVLLF